MPEAVTIAEAARALRVSVRQLRRYIADGAPQSRVGGRGRGRKALVDVEAIAAWRRSRAASQANDDALVVVAVAFPEILAAAMHAAFVETDGPHKRATAGVLAGAWYLASTAILDYMRERAPGIPELKVIPEKIEQLRSHFFGL